jgi:hypothetical protein
MKENKVRVCVMIDDTIHKKLKDIQAFIIKETAKNYSYSRTVNEILDLGLEDRKLADVLQILVEERSLKGI